MRGAETGITLVTARHGRSRKNDLKIIQNLPLRGILSFGLTDEGREQVATNARDNNELLSGAVIYASPFKRARETAKIIKKETGNTGRIHYSWRLRERSFGAMEGHSQKLYKLVRQLDGTHPDHGVFGVETVSSVAERIGKLLNRVQRRHHGRTVLFVGHGDGLQFAESIYKGEEHPDKTYTSHTMLKPGEIRNLQQSK